ncbi:MAG: DNA cytosine methyltransferase [Verrucomicrobiota bacterium]
MSNQRTPAKQISRSNNEAKRRRNSVRTITAIDLFAGAGGFSLAAEEAGVKVLAAVECDNWAQATYRANFIDGRRGSDRHRLYGDVMDIEPSDMLMDVRLEKGELDLLIGGPPCQGFSSHRLNDAGVNDPRNELLLRYFDFVKGLRPKIFLVENVSGMLWKRHEAYVQKFKHLARRNGYRLVGGGPQIINARDFGVPQNRKRVFILGVRNDVATPEDFQWPPKPTHYSPNSKEAQNGAPIWKPAAEVFEKPLDKADPNNLHMQPGSEMLERFKRTPKNGGSRSDSGYTLECHKTHKGHKDVYGRIDSTKPGPTMTTGCINPSKGRFVHPIKHHGITARHAARFQTFPDSFIFQGGLGQAGKQIGNAVPIALGEKIIRSVLESIDEQKDAKD